MGGVGGNERGLALEAAVGQLTQSINNLLELLNIGRQAEGDDESDGSDST